ncbi:MAG TPA: tRNA threonylcarbamoyladenosine dehydratase [Burkholderiaceae bacterium]
MDLARRFGGISRLYGAAGYEKLRRARIAVAGLGGVGSWAAEALARSGVGSITLIDLDHVAESNANRQIHALGDEFGKAKVLAMAERIALINPWARTLCVEEFVTPDNVQALIRDVDVVIDCIDQVSAKAALIAHARRLGMGVVTCGAAGGRIDPTRIRCDDLARALGDPLLSKVRYRLRRDYQFPRAAAGRSGGGAGARLPRFGVPAVFSDEPVRTALVEAGPADSGEAPERTAGAPLACAGYGSTVVLTAPLGFAAAARALDWILAA